MIDVVAQALVGLGIDLSTVNTIGDLQGGLEEAERILGYSIERWLTEPTFWKDHLHPEDRDWAVEFCLKATAEKRNYDFQYRMIGADGRTVWFHDVVTVVVEDDRPKKLRGVLVDITERKRAEEVVRRSEKELRDVINTVPANVWSTSPDGGVDFINQRWQEFTGLLPENALGWKNFRTSRGGSSSTGTAISLRLSRSPSRT